MKKNKTFLIVTVIIIAVIIGAIVITSNQKTEPPQTTEPPQPTNSVFEPTKTEGNTAETE